jgi:REP element-mobilizing transposase RayT
MHHRRSIRLQGYDHTQNGAYFVTICAYQKVCLFGRILDGEMLMNDWGKIVQQEWEKTTVLRPSVELDAFVVMPNHVHGIIVISHDDMDGRGMMHHAPTRREFPKPIANSLSSIGGAFKAAVTRRINQSTAPGHPIWQRNYYQHIIRIEESLNAIRMYVTNHPALWEKDSLYVVL